MAIKKTRTAPRLPPQLGKSRGWIYAIKFKPGTHIVRTGSRSDSPQAQRWKNISLKNMLAVLAGEPVRLFLNKETGEYVEAWSAVKPRKRRRGRS